MSIGGLVGAVVGGVIGFIIGGGPVGAFYGAALGFALGMVVDPMTPDIPSVGAPDQAELVMSNMVGGPIPDLAGTAKITGHLLCYGNESGQAQYSKSSGGGKGGGDDPDPVITGYKYYMSWAVGICIGQVDTLLAIYKDEELLWEGELDCPESGGQETIVLSGDSPPPGTGAITGWAIMLGLKRFGGSSVEFYFGTADHAINSKVGELLDDATLNTPYRNMCWAFFDNLYIGEYNRAPTMKFIVKKIPENVFSTSHEIQKYDSNPAHITWYILHNLVGLPESWLHSADFAALALTLFYENRGMSILFDRQQSALSYLESINSHIDNILRYGTDGKFHPKLIRDDYTVGDLPLIDESVMLDEPTFNRKSWIDTINEMKVQYTEIPRVKGVKEALWAFGGNVYGELGLGDITFRSSPVQVGTLTNWSNVSCGGWHTMSIKTDGTLWTFGYNGDGSLGLGDIVPRSSPVQVGALTDWGSIAGGGWHTMGIKIDGTLWAFGGNYYGQLGLGDRISLSSPVQVGALTTWINISCHYNHTMGIKIDGTLWAFGGNYYGQLGLGDIVDRSSPVQVGALTNWGSMAGGCWHTAGVKTDGTLWTFGRNGDGQLGLGDIVPRSSPVQVGALIDWSSIACGCSHTVGIKTDGTLWSFGRNDKGQLGLGDITFRSSPVQVGTLTNWSNVSCGDYHTMAIKTDDTLWTFGYNGYGSLGLGDIVDRSSPVQVGALTNWNDVSCGYYHTAGIETT